MRNLIITISLLLSLKIVSAQSNTLTLVWSQPPGFSSTLYEATNLLGTWSPLQGVTNPPQYIQATQSQAFFYVTVTPTNVVHDSISGMVDPTNDVPAGYTYVNSATGDFWVNQYGGGDGWVELIEGDGF